MAIGDAAAAAGIPIVPGTKSLTFGFEDINALADYIAGLLPRLMPVGTSLPGYWTVAPTGYLLEDGSVQLRATYPALFTALGTRFNTGGESTLQFRLPDSRGRVEVGKSATGQFSTVGAKVGAETVALTEAQNGPHTHSYAWGGINVTPGGEFSAMYPVGFDATRPTGSSGLGQGHNNVQPSIVVTRAIKY